MILERLRRHVVDPLYNNHSYSGQENIVLDYAIAQCDRRARSVLSMVIQRDVHPHMEGFPWRELEELMGEHMSRAVYMIQRRALITSTSTVFNPTVFDNYCR
jgi:predicted component of type VI protein secretion system